MLTSQKMTKSLRMRVLYLLHFVLMTAVMSTACLTMYAPSLEAQYAQTVSTAVFLCYLILSIFFYRTYNAYKIGMYRAGETFYSQTLANLFSNALTYIFACLIRQRVLTCLPALAALAVQTTVSGIWCLAANHIYFRTHKPLRTLVIYKEDEDLDKLNEIVFFENRFDVIERIQSLGDVFELLPRLNGYQAVIVSGVEATLRNGIVKACIDKNINCFFIPHTGDVIIAGAKHVQSFSIPIMETGRAVLSPEYAFIKRAMDVVCSALALVMLSPLMAVTALCIKAYDRGPVLYKQVRLTKDRKVYHILKFRSMVTFAEKDGVARLACDHDNRITPVGRIIRATRIDELPQLINILMGDMTIVGPRPERPEIAAQYEKEMPAFSLRLQVKAGLTGVAQVYGRYNTEPKDKLKMDLMYINNMSLREDLKLIFATIKILLVKESTQGVAQGQTTAVKPEKAMEKSA